MTCVVGLVDGDTVVMGADSAAVAGWSMTVRADPKMFHNGPFLIGCTSSFRMGQVLRFRFVPPPHNAPDKTDYEYMATDFVDAARECFKFHGYAKVEGGQESGGTFLVAYRGGIYEVHGDFQVAIPADPFSAIGDGSDLAKGALFASDGDPAERRIRVALSAAQRYNAAVREPFVVDWGTP